MALIAVHVDAVEEICAHYLRRKRREYARAREVAIGQRMQPTGWRRLIQAPCSRVVALKKLDGNGKVLDTLSKGWIKTFEKASTLAYQAQVIQADCTLFPKGIPYMSFSDEECSDFALELSIFKKAVVRPH